MPLTKYSCSVSTVNNIHYHVQIHTYNSESHTIHYTLKAINNTDKILSEHTVLCYLPKESNTNTYSSSCIFIKDIKFNISLYTYSCNDNTLNYQVTISNTNTSEILSEYTVLCYLPKPVDEVKPMVDEVKPVVEEVKPVVEEVKPVVEEVKPVADDYENIKYIRNIIYGTENVKHADNIRKMLKDVDVAIGSHNKNIAAIKLFDYIIGEALSFTNNNNTFRNSVINKCYEFKNNNNKYSLELMKKCEEVLANFGMPLRRSERIKNLPRVNYANYA